MGVGHSLAGAWFLGVEWPLSMLAYARDYLPLERASQEMNHFAIRPALAYSLHDVPMMGTGLTVVACGAVAGVLLVNARRWTRDHEGVLPLWALFVTGTMLVSLRLYDDDFGVLLLPVLWVFETLRDRGPIGLPVRLFGLGLYLSDHLYTLGAVWGWQPLRLLIARIFGRILWWMPSIER